MKPKPLLILPFTILTFIFILLPLIGKSLFLRPFLSYAFGLHLFALFALVLLTILLLRKQTSINIQRPSTSVVITLVWILFVAAYPLLGVKSEAYYRTYLLVTLLTLLCVYVLLRVKAVGLEGLYLPMVLVGFIEAITVLLQYFHIIASHSTYFSTTGTGINPNLAAMTICITLPAVMGLWYLFDRKFRPWISGVVMIMVVAIIVTQCRSALLALTVISAIFLIRFIGTIPSRKMRALLLAIPVVIASFFFLANRQKQASADGRLTIWKLSTEMITQNPVTGYGYGFFEKAYNLYQAEYFNKEPRPDAERMNASYTAMAYNEYLEQGVMGGLLGVILFTAFILTLLASGFRPTRRTVKPFTVTPHSVVPFSGVLAFGVMSLFNFTVAYPVVFLFLLFYAAIQMSVDADFQQYKIGESTLKKAGSLSATNTKPLSLANIHPLRVASNNILSAANVNIQWQRTSKKIVLGFSIISIVFVLFSLQKYGAQRELTKADAMMKKGQLHQTGQILQKIEPIISTSEAYWQTKAHYDYAKRDLNAVRYSMLQTLELTSNPYLMLDLAQITLRLGDEKQAERLLRTACGIEPHLLMPRIQQMQFYSQTGQQGMARSTARYILSMKPKFDTKQARDFKAMAELQLTKSTTAVL